MEKHYPKLTILITLLYIVITFLFLWNKYHNLGYNAIDLGIYNQVFFNTSQGRVFQFSIHPHSYLGDHFEIFILLLIPFYLICQSPLNLVFLQLLFISASVWPLYLITKKILPGKWPFFTALAFLLNPFTLNIIFFEFHILPFAIFFLLWLFYFYQKKKIIPFIIFMLLSLLIREDVALVVVMFSLLALIEKRELKWILVPGIIGGIWFIIAFQLVGFFNASSGYKFLTYYHWLGSSLPQIFLNLIFKPWLVIKHLFTLNNIFLIIGLILPLLGLPLLKPKYLLPSILIIGQMLLAGFSSTVVLETHYTSLLLPFIFIAGIYGFKNILEKKTRFNFLTQLISRQKALFFSILTAAILYSFFTFSPFLPALHALIIQKNKPLAKKNWKIINQIGKNSPVVASLKFLPPLSQRQNLFSLHYAFWGKRQYSNKNYKITTPINSMLVDYSDFIIYQVQAGGDTQHMQQYPTGDKRIRELIKNNQLKLVEIADNIGLYQKSSLPGIKLVEIFDQSPNKTAGSTPTIITDNLKLISVKKNKDNQLPNNLLPISLVWQTTKGKIEQNLILELTIKDFNGKTIYRQNYPLGYGIYPASSWPKGKFIQTNYWVYLPSENIGKITLSIKKIQGYLSLDGQRSAKLEITKQEILSQPIKIPKELYK